VNAGDYGSGAAMASRALRLRSMQRVVGHAQLLRARQLAVLRTRLSSSVFTEMCLLLWTNS